MSKHTLASARAKAGYSQLFVADYLDVAPSTVRNWEKGITFPKQPMIEKMCELYNVPYDDIDFNPGK